MEILGLKNPVTEIRSSIGGFTARLVTVQEGIRKLKERSIEIPRMKEREFKEQ